jgi:hypothetical protein
VGFHKRQSRKIFTKSLPAASAEHKSIQTSG